MSEAIKERFKDPEFMLKKKLRDKNMLGNEYHKLRKTSEHSEETKQKISNANKGKKRSFETRKLMSDNAKKRTFSLETRKRMAESQRLAWKKRKET